MKCYANRIGLAPFFICIRSQNSANRLEFSHSASQLAIVLFRRYHASAYRRLDTFIATLLSYRYRLPPLSRLRLSPPGFCLLLPLLLLLPLSLPRYRLLPPPRCFYRYYLIAWILSSSAAVAPPLITAWILLPLPGYRCWP